MERTPTPVRIWLLTICISLVLMITLGGITRLTGSGLSITDWKPILGVIPPLNLQDWEEAFSKYKEIPQYRLLNSSMTLSEFKQIYFWEWFHRLFGRGLGLLTFIPAAYFWWKKSLPQRLRNRILIGLSLGGLQGALGWFMVLSGLSDRTSVSHLRLAAHLNLAFIILFYFAWITRDAFQDGEMSFPSDPKIQNFLRPYYWPTVGLFFMQTIYGAFVAGMKAGLIFNTFPKMEGTWFPPNFWSLDPKLINLWQNPAAIQWIHRAVGTLFLIWTMGMWIRIRQMGAVRGPVRRFTTGLAHLTFVQFALGVFTLLYSVPIPLGVLHQFGAALLVVFLALLGHSLTRRVSIEFQS